ncbi:MAG: ferritin-like domain-containing protein [Polaromonas sp.]|uniref:ferritin-like domain-containing protein n=1 Tax=Polaromonas sp. TaxID=1869339 RepID=UPI002732DD6B|nr:ferritin-like domain-containing protein [Polaromonas sp.]MDP2820072.1 ferritin-like domain-containing protein [Polaromonas sp.]
MNVQNAARRVLAERDIETKLAGAAQLWASWQADALSVEASSDAPLDTAGIPERPHLAPPASMPRRQLNGPENHAALIHALAHIEFNAINLALDAVQRFSDLPRDFYGDWLRVAAEEAYHFRLLRDHLRSLGKDYGDLPAHAGLWEMAEKTAHDPLARMALVPRLLEARGLDVTPDIQRKLRGFGDAAGADILDIILRDEIGHVAAGDRWFRYLCAQRGLQPEAAFQTLLATPGIPRPRRPFNEAARLAAGFSAEELAELDSVLIGLSHPPTR